MSNHDSIEAKCCNRCKAIKPVSDFTKRKDSKDGLQRECRACATLRQKEWRAANPDRERETRHAYYARHPEMVKAKNAKTYAKDPEKARARGRAYYALNKQKALASTVAWMKAHPEEMAVYRHTRRARQHASGGKIAKGLAASLFNLQRGKCACCGLPLGKDYHLDHVVPLALGGSNTDDNIQLLRKRCNHQKGAKDPIDFMQLRGKLL